MLETVQSDQTPDQTVGLKGTNHNTAHLCLPDADAAKISGSNGFTLIMMNN